MNIDRLPFTGFDTTWSVKPGAGPDHVPDYDPDSASTGTMWATGQKTIDERISQGPSTAIDVPGENLRDRPRGSPRRRARRPATSRPRRSPTRRLRSLASHMSLRGCQGPEDTAEDCPTETKAAGGLGSIAEQMVDHKVDVTLGGGRGRFEQTIEGGPATARPSSTTPRR